jgi:hypothetical protein
MGVYLEGFVAETQNITGISIPSATKLVCVRLRKKRCNNIDMHNVFINVNGNINIYVSKSMKQKFRPQSYIVR